MSIKINSFGGILVWWFRKNFSQYTSRIALETAARIYQKKTVEYIKKFNSSEEKPLFRLVNIETINRCNGSCAFCPANARSEKRSLKKMDEMMYKNIINQLAEISWEGQIFLNVNNEPLLDKNIIEYARYAKETLGSNVLLSMFTNGTLLTIEKLEKLAEYLDILIINNYGERYSLNENNRKIYKYVKKNRKYFENIDITINRRYSQEILATRAGSAPNKKEKNNNVNSPCIYPFTDLTIFPDGKVGLCCNDCFEVTDYGNINEEKLIEIWNSQKFDVVRNRMEKGRNYFEFCKECDVIDSVCETDPWI